MPLTEVIIKVVGTAQDIGVPHVGCNCSHCQLAYENPKFQRNAAALAVVLPDIRKWYLIDATPHLNQQIRVVEERFKVGISLEGVFLTHAHIGHFTGLMFFGREAMSTRKMPVYIGEKMEGVLRNNLPWKQLVELENISLIDISPEKPVRLESSVTITPQLVPHRDEYSETFGFIISGPTKKLLYIPDIDRWELWVKDLKDVLAQVDYALVDATFFSEGELKARGRDPREVPHPLIIQTMHLLKDLDSQKRSSVYFTHFNHTNPVVDPKSDVHSLIKRQGFSIAQEGMEFKL